MRTALSLMDSTHLARKPKPSQQNLEAGSGDYEHPQVAEDVSEQSALGDMSMITETMSLISTVENVELLESINAAEELPQLTGDDVVRNVPTVEQTEMKKPSVPYEVIRQRYKVKRLLQPTATATAGQLVEQKRGDVAERQAATEPVSTTPQQTLAAHASTQQEQSRVTSHRAASPAARIKSRQVEEEKRGSPRPHGARGSTRSRSPAREAHGYQRRDPRRDRYSRSPRCVERRATPRSSPARRLQHERGRAEWRRDDHRPREREPPDTNEQLFAEFLSFVKRRRE